MSTVSEEDKMEMSVEKQREYCKWCFHHDYGNCQECTYQTTLKLMGKGL